MPRPLRSRLALALGTLSYCACAHAPHTSAPPAIAAEPAPQAAPTAAPASPQLARDATYVELVRAAAALEGGGAFAPGACLLERNARGFALSAELAAAVRPLPLPPEDLDQALKQADRVEVLSAWGRYGDGGGKLALASFTTSAPAQAALALVLTDRGVALRPAGANALAGLDGLDASRAAAALDAQPDAAVFVAAEAGVPLAEVARTLAALAHRKAPVALAVTLAPGTTLPRPNAAHAAVERCPNGLPATDLPEGNLPREALAAGVAPLKEQAPACLGQGDARGAAGGRLAIAIRVGAQGSVQQACLVRDELGDPGVAACVIELARRLSFAPPQPSGVLDIELPLALRPGVNAGQRPLCDVPDGS